MDAKDQGHRYGNFPNYYTFHPPTNRLSVLEDTNILSYIRHGLRNSSSSNDDGKKKMIGSDSDKEVNDDGDGERATKKLRIEETKSQQSSDCIYYCDLGCNEGDLTLAMASSLVSKKYTSNYEHDTTRDESVVVDNSNVSESKVGSSASVKVLGLDLDPMLIDRANNKLASSIGSIGVDDQSKNVEEISTLSGIDATFKVCNLCSESEHNNAYRSYINEQNGTSTSTGESSTITQEVPTQLFHLTTIFSTTMWIHVHSGDIGLKSFLERACLCTKKFLLIEPQPSGW